MELLHKFQPRFAELASEASSAQASLVCAERAANSAIATADNQLWHAYLSIEVAFHRLVAEAIGLPAINFQVADTEQLLVPACQYGSPQGATFLFRLGECNYCGTTGRSGRGGTLAVTAGKTIDATVYSPATYSSLIPGATAWNAARYVFLALAAIQQHTSVSLAPVALLPWLLGFDTVLVLENDAPPCWSDPFRHMIAHVPRLGAFRIATKPGSSDYELVVPMEMDQVGWCPLSVAAIAPHDLASISVHSMLSGCARQNVATMPDHDACTGRITLVLEDYGPIFPPADTAPLAGFATEALVDALDMRSHLIAFRIVAETRANKLVHALSRATQLNDNIVHSHRLAAEWNAQWGEQWPGGVTWFRLRTATAAPGSDVQVVWCADNLGEIARLEVGRIASTEPQSGRLDGTHTVQLRVRGQVFPVARFDIDEFAAAGKTLGGLDPWQVLHGLRALLDWCHNACGLRYRPCEIVKYPASGGAPPPGTIYVEDLRLHTASWPESMYPVDDPARDTYMFRRNLPFMDTRVDDVALHENGTRATFDFVVPAATGRLLQTARLATGTFVSDATRHALCIQEAAELTTLPTEQQYTARWRILVGAPPGYVFCTRHPGIM